MRIIFVLLLLLINPVFAAENIFSSELKEIEGETSQQKTYSDKLKEIEKNIKQGKEHKLITNGKGIWINIWNYPKNPEALMTKLRKYNLDTIYLQINRSTTDIYYNQTGLDAVLKAAHEREIKVIGWSYCYLRNIELDVRKFTEPALYLSPEGQSLDGMAADIEENTALASVKAYTEKIKKKVPKDYPLLAIVFSPRIKTYYPWEYIGDNWDVLMPMTYWHGLKRRNEETVYNFVADTVEQLRKYTKRDDLNIHLITDGEKTTPKEIITSLKAARDLGVNAGFSLYPEHLATEEMLEKLGSF